MSGSGMMNVRWRRFVFTSSRWYEYRGKSQRQAENLAIHKGAAAAQTFMETLRPDLSVAERDTLRADLLADCRQARRWRSRS